MRLLPKWALVNAFPSIYEFESVTAIQQTARVYGAINQMIEEYNKFAEEINKEIVEFIGSSGTEIENFKNTIEKRIRCKFEDMDATLAKMKVDAAKYTDAKIVEIYQQQISDQVDQIVNEKIVSGDIKITLVYDPETESLNMTTEGV